MMGPWRHGVVFSDDESASVAKEAPVGMLRERSPGVWCTQEPYWGLILFAAGSAASRCRGTRRLMTITTIVRMSSSEKTRPQHSPRPTHAPVQRAGARAATGERAI